VQADKVIHVLVLCTGNSARSQMAEGLFRTIGRTSVVVQSAGSAPANHINPYAVQVMAEVGIDISQQQPKQVDSLLGQAFDYVITVCDNARDNCPYFPGPTERLHWSFADPASVVGGDDTKLPAFRAVREGLTACITSFLDDHSYHDRTA